MNGYLSRLALRAMGEAGGLLPRMASRFEEAALEDPSPPTTPALGRAMPTQPARERGAAAHGEPSPLPPLPLPHAPARGEGHPLPAQEAREISFSPIQASADKPATRETGVGEIHRPNLAPEERNPSSLGFQPQALGRAGAPSPAKRGRAGEGVSETREEGPLPSPPPRWRAGEGGRPLAFAEVSHPTLRPQTALPLSRGEGVRWEKGPGGEGPPPIHVSIGRIEVKAIHPTPAQPAPSFRPVAAAPLSSLDDYLARRREGS